MCKPLGLAPHIRLAHTEEGKEFIKMGNNAVRDKPSWNSGLTAQDDKRIADAANKISEANKGKSRSMSDAAKKKISDKMKEVGGGYRIGSGRGKKGWYKGFFCDSSWELAFVIFNLDHNIKITRSSEIRTYIFEDRIKRYFPDFEVNGQLVEIKGYRSAQWEAKLQSNQDVKVYYQKEMQEILAYVIEKYGKNYLEMYE
jgi:hypothetical protein